MYNILVVDDEELICRGLKSMIGRMNHESIKEVYASFDADSAEQMIRDLEPDIVITDIRMPVYTGLDLIKSTSKFAPNVKFIVLSGYDDFEYVKEAFKLGIVDYLLKPASMDELKTVLEKVIGTISAERQKKLNQQSSMYQYTQTVLENNLNKIFAESHLPAARIKEMFGQLDITFAYPQFGISIIAISYRSLKSKNNERILHYLGESSKSFAEKHEAAVFYFFNYHNDLVLLFNFSSRINDELLEVFIQKFTDTLKVNMELEYFIAMSETIERIESIVEGYEHAREALTYKIIYGPFDVIRYSQLKYKINKTEAFDRHLNKLKEFILSYNSVEVSNLVDELFNKDYLKEYNIETIRRLYKSVIRLVIDLANEDHLARSSESYTEFYSFDYISDIKIYLKSIIFDAITLIKEKNKEKSIIDVAKKYVHENFHKNIDMSMAANMVSMSYSYFSKLFKDETGMNYSDYLLKVRMEKALELLNNPVNRVQDIAFKVGYDNPKHFTRAFKNYFGVSPKEYRDSQ